MESKVRVTEGLLGRTTKSCHILVFVQQKSQEMSVCSTGLSH